MGPIPDMYEPVWYSDKTWSFDGEAFAAIAAFILVVIGVRQRRPGVPWPHAADVVER